MEKNKSLVLAVTGVLKKKFPIQLALIFLTALMVNFVSVPASAYPGGVSGYSGKSGSTCTMCHSTGAAPAITWSGPTSINSGSTATFTLTVGGGGNGGLDVAASSGTFAAGSGTQVMGGEITHTSANSTHSWTFTWTAPTVTASTVATIYGAAIDGAGGGTGTTKQSITVMPAAPPPTPTMVLSPTSLAFSYTQGGATPAAKTLAINSSGTALSYTVAASGGTWLMAAGNSSTPGNVSVSVNSAGLSAGTYNGSVTVTSAGASNSPQSVPVTLTVASSTPPPPPPGSALTISPGSLAFSYTMGGSAPAAKSLSIGSSGSALSYTAAASGGSWLVATGGGNTPGNVSVSINTAGMSAGTYNGSIKITASGASNSPQTVPVTLTVTSSTPPPPPPPTGGTLSVYPTRLVFYSDGSDAPAAKAISVRSSGSPLTFTAAVYGGSWMSVTPTGGTTAATVKVSAYATGLPAGTYSCVLQFKAGNSVSNVELVLVVGTSQSGGGEDDHTDTQVRPFTFEPGAQGTSGAYWRAGTGASPSNSDPTNQGLVLIKPTSAPTTAIVGAVVKGAAGSQLSSLGFDVRTDSECTTRAPQFVVVTSDNVTHTAGCTSGSAQRLSVSHWKRVSFNPGAQLTPPVQPGTTVKTIALVMDHISANGYAVVDNVNLNGRYLGKQ